LVEQALASGMPFETTLISDTAPILHDIIQDYCRQQWRQAEPLLVNYFLSKEEFSLSSLYAFVSGILHQGQARVLKPSFLFNGQLYQQTEQFFNKLQQLWQSEKTLIQQLVLEKLPVLNGKKYREDWVLGWFEKIDLGLSIDLMAALKDKDLLVCLERFAYSRLQAALKNNSIFPQHRFFDGCQQLAELLAKTDKQLQLQGIAFKCDLLVHSGKALLERLHAKQAQSFDMQIKGLAKALTHTDTGQVLAQALRQKYPVALVDEFQDTDNYQYQILQHMYLQAEARKQNCALFLVGDPKQAIYRFRGADVYTYLKAYQQVAKEQRHHLNENQRSVAPLVQGLNRFFQQQADAFKQEKIVYHAVEVGQRAHSPLIDTRESPQANYQPLRFIYWPIDKVTVKEQARDWAINSTVAEIIYLLTGAANGQVLLGERAVEAKDMVILVRSHFEGSLCQAELAKSGIKAALQSNKTVFESEEAEDMSRVLAAFAEPHNEGKVRAVLASRLCGATLADLVTWQANAKLWTQHLIRFQNYHKLWQQKGFIVAWREFLQQEGAIARLAQLPQGERILTNFLHLADLLHEEYRQRAGMRQLSDWFLQQRLEPKNSVNGELRLESDENLIRIITIHQSKGLEYPIVFVPTLWNPPDPTRNTPFYHQDDEAIFNLNPELDEQAQQALRNETLSEELRLGYVALTRAAQRCYIHWCPYESKDSVKNSPLGHWLVEGLTSLQKLQQQAPQLIALQAAEPVELPMLKINNQANTPMTVPSAPKVAWGYRLTSFSSLQQGAKALQTDYEVLEIKDDEGKEIVLEYEDQEVQLARFNFAGKKVLATSVGNCLHKIFEHADFTKPVADWQENIERQLKAHGIIASWQDDVVHWLNEVMQARLMPNLRLSQLSHEYTLRELDFHLPLNQFQTTALIRCLQKYGIAVGELPYQTITGFLKGSIDLVFQHQGQYFIADYKSNHLGHQLEHYQSDKLHETMFSHGYNLQAAIYSLALHRWLSSQLRDYQPERHFGGVFYLFLRGMNVHGTEGIYHWQPNLKLLDELVDLLGSY
ncbi:MAG TPA: 3'-5' exonuclease, partial [Agitococcus sp.]|nr:3'-5' exonuclease [Agitococcus sp.]